MYEALLENNYIVADQSYNDKRRPKSLKRYLLDKPYKIHSHIGHMNGTNNNELSLMVPVIMKHRDEEFLFIKDLIWKQ